MKIENIQKALNDVNCPNCDKKRLQAVLRCDISAHEDCVAEAECGNCTKKFHINGNIEEGSVSAVCQIQGMSCTIVPA